MLNISETWFLFFSFLVVIALAKGIMAPHEQIGAGLGRKMNVTSLPNVLKVSLTFPPTHSYTQYDTVADITLDDDDDTKDDICCECTRLLLCHSVKAHTFGFTSEKYEKYYGILR